MKVEDLIKELEKMPKRANVVFICYNNDGCDTCGFGASEHETDVDGVRVCDDNKIVRLTGY
jgi:hypothetical protein